MTQPPSILIYIDELPKEQFSAYDDFQHWIDLYNDGSIDASQLVSELEFGGFDGDLFDIL